MVNRILAALSIMSSSSAPLKTFAGGGTRQCAKCHEEKPLDTDHYQVVQYFRTGFSYYCNECNKPKPREDNS